MIFRSPVGVLALCSVVACSSTQFPYRRYSLDLRTDTLLASEIDGTKDRPLSDCQLKNGGSQCFVFFADEYAKMRSDYAEAMRKLKKCGDACK